MKTQTFTIPVILALATLVLVTGISGQQNTTHGKVPGYSGRLIFNSPAAAFSPAEAASFADKLVATNFTVPGFDERNFTVGNVGGAEHVAFSLLTDGPDVDQINLRVFFGPTYTNNLTAVAEGDLQGSDSYWTNVLTATVPVHGSICGVRVINDGSGSVAVRRLTAYFVR